MAGGDDPHRAFAEYWSPAKGAEDVDLEDADLTDEELVAAAIKWFLA
jgi:hypothetical protein